MYVALFEVFDLLIHDLHRFLHKVKFNFNLNLIERVDKVLIRERLGYFEEVPDESPE